ncbi:MAG: prepilin-type N-terminal cleavage/methylation domain-containing protein [Candidatus Magasanikbacteria bacterium]|jgi:competence protein ComGC
MKNIYNKKSGFTLIEVLLYVGITSFMLLTINIFIATVLQSRIKNQTVLVVENSGVAIMQTIIQTLRNATQINISNPQTISATMPDGQQIVFGLENQVINSTQSGTIYPLIPSDVSATSLQFTNLAPAEKPASIQIIFNLENLSPEGRNETTYSQTFYDTATLRK